MHRVGGSRMKANVSVVGLLPAAGRARRLRGLIEGSKEAVQVRRGDEPPIPVAWHAVEALALAGVGRVELLVGEHKRDLVQRLEAARGERAAAATGPLRRRLDGLDLRYRATPETPSPTHTLALALADEQLRDADVALAFPDILFEPRTAFAWLLETLATSSADVLLGCFPAQSPEKTDMVEMGSNGVLRRLWIKQPDRGLRYTWQIAVWRPAFSRLVVAAARRWDDPARAAVGAACADGSATSELHVGRVIEQAVEEGLEVCCVPFPHGSCRDIGTPEELAAVRVESGPGERAGDGGRESG